MAKCKGRGILFIEEALGLGFISGPIGLEWAWPKIPIRVALNLFSGIKCSCEICFYREQSGLEFRRTDD
jgi:hypothetical protein